VQQQVVDAMTSAPQGGGALTSATGVVSPIKAVNRMAHIAFTSKS